MVECIQSQLKPDRSSQTSAMRNDSMKLLLRLIRRWRGTLRLAVIGSSSLFHPDSEGTCVAIGNALAKMRSLAVITGGRAGVGELVGRAIHRTRFNGNQEPYVYHLLPIGCSPLDYGETLFCGPDIIERREVLGRVAKLYLAIEGGRVATSTKPRSHCPIAQP